MKKYLIAAEISAVFLAAAIFMNPVIKSAVTKGIARVTGVPVHIDVFSLNILDSTISISGFKMYNPGDFPEGIMVYCPKIKIIYDRASLFKTKRHFLIMVIELKEMRLVKNIEGKLNVDSLKIVKQSKLSLPMPLQVDLLNLNIGKIVYKDYTKGAKPSVRVLDVNKNISYKSIPTFQQLALLVLAEPVKSAVIKNAEIYGFAVLAGVSVVPVVASAVFTGKDSVRQDIEVSYENAYEASLVAVKRMGRITSQDKLKGTINARIGGAAVALHVAGKADNRAEITVSARKYLFPALGIAGGVLSQVLDEVHPQ